VGEKAGEGVLLDGFDFAAEPGKRLAANLAKDFSVAPLAMQAAGAEAAFKDAIFSGEQAQRVFDDFCVEGETLGNFAQREWAVCARVAADEL